MKRKVTHQQRPGATKTKQASSSLGGASQTIQHAPEDASKQTRLLLIILLATFVAFIPVLSASFVAWDDGVYVYDNPIVKSLSNLKLLLTTPVAGGNHHPLTMLSLAFNYQFSGEEAWSYHLLNLIIHLVNCFLVYRFAMLLSKGSTLIAFTTAILFGIHPVHVESVAWVSERKDVLYGMFFIAGLITYTRYVDSNSRKQYIITLGLLILSLLSKPAAVIFPVALFCIDFLRQRKLNLKLLTEKIPFFIPAILMGLLTYMAQKEAGATSENVFGLGSRVLFGFYGIMMYFFKMFIPINLAPVYPFPSSQAELPLVYYLSPLFFIALAALFFYSWRKYRVIAFGILFYLVNLLLVLQVLQVGLSVISDRYTYIPYIGLFYAAGWCLCQFTKEDISRAYYIVIPVAFILVILSYRQSAAWSNSETLWDHAINAQPSTVAYTGKAMILVDNKKYDEAVQYYSEALKLDPAYHEAYLRRGNIYMETNKLDLAYQDYKTALVLKPNYYMSLVNMGGLLGRMGKYDSALVYLDKGLAINPDYKMAIKNRALTYENLQRYREAIADFQSFLKHEPDNADINNEVGRCYQLINEYEKAIPFITKAIALNPSGAYYLNRSYAYKNLGNNEAAINDAVVAKQKGVHLPDDYSKGLGM